jgi:zinc and cadmium transporter
MISFFYPLASVVIVSLVSLVGVFVLLLRAQWLKSITPLLVSFAVGSLLGDAFLHLLPESFESISSPHLAPLLTILGILLFFTLEKFLNWHHCHDPDCHDSPQSVISLNLVGDSAHNFIDGMLIGASFFVSPTLGFTTTLAVLLHEIPQEVGDLGILLHHGLAPAKALWLNLVSALFAVLGLILVYLVGSSLVVFSIYLLPVTAGGFIYLAASDLIPELHRHQPRLVSSVTQLLFILLGVLLMFLLLFIE